MKTLTRLASESTSPLNRATAEALLTETRQEMVAELAALSCGHSCVLAKPRGMATNGPCRCLDGLDDPHRRARVRRAIALTRGLAGLT